MAQKGVHLIVGRLLTEQKFRATFLDRPLETLMAVREAGLELTNVEIDALAQTDRRLWQLGPEWVDARLQVRPVLPERASAGE
ncbi:MAG TPA: Os1348 family NHLP clan protein [Vicinamibacterales bacterium]|nr:Os1348 family NHLP clan protein [Vicinamibacterales bacterium]